MLVRVIICASIILTIVTGRIKSGDVENLTDEDDEDYFGEAREATYLRDDFYRKRRSDEEGFYHTLLSRTEPQHVFKRSHGTEDFEHSNNAQFITERDWSGSSKISDADRKELESLFSKLNPDDSDEKNDVTRSISDEDSLSPLDNAAKQYSAWLMTQPASKIAAALTQKAQVDNRLTRLFFDKRGLDKILPNNIPVRNVKKSIIKSGGHKQNRKTGAASLKNLDAKHLIMSGPKLCNDDSPKCLCTRACYPNVVLTSSPCTCDAKNKANIPVPSSAPFKNVTDAVQHDDAKKRVLDPYARSWCTQACHPLNVITDNPCKCTENLETRTTVATTDTVSDASSKSTSETKSAPLTATGKTENLLPQASAATKTSVPPQALSTSKKQAPAEAKVEVFPPQAPAAAKTVVFPPQAPAATKPGVFPPQAPAAAKTEVFPPQSPSPAVIKAVVFPPQAPAAAKAEIAVEKVSATVNETTPDVKSKTPTAEKTSSQVITQPSSAPATGDAEASAATATISPPVPISSSPDANATKSEPPTTKSAEPTATTAGAAPVVPSAESGGIFGSPGPIYIDSPNYQGCFKDRKPVRDLPKRFTRFDTTPEACISECKYQNYKFAGVQYGYLCFCGNAFGRYGKVTDKECNSFCNGDSKRKCGAFWHNSVYSVDGKQYDPNVFDFVKVDEEERIRDKLSPPVVKSVKKSSTKRENHINIQGVNAATHLMNAAQATLKAAKKLLPGVTKKHKIGKSATRGKRDDNEDDEELMLERENVLVSLKAAHQILQKTNFERYRRNSEKEKRSINEDFDPYDPDDGKDLLKAYMSNVEAYNRQVRSVDDEEEDDETSDKDNFQYRRMAEADLNEGQFVDKFEDSEHLEDDTSELTTRKRSAEKDVSENDKKAKNKRDSDKSSKSVVSSKNEDKTTQGKRRSITDVTEDITHPLEDVPNAKDTHSQNPEKRSSVEGSGGGDIKKRSTSESTFEDRPINPKKEAPVEGDKIGHEPAKRSLKEEKVVTALHEGSGGGEMKKRSLPETKATVSQLHAPYEGSGGGELKKRSLPEIKETASQLHAPNEGSGGGELKKRSIPDTKKVASRLHAPYEGSGGGDMKKRSLPEIKETASQLHAPYEGSGGGELKKRSLPEVKETASQLHAPYEGSGGGELKKRSLPEIKETATLVHPKNEASGWVDVKKRSVVETKETASQLHAPYEGSGGGELKKRSLPEIKDSATQLNIKHEGSGGVDVKKRSLPESKETLTQLHARYEGSGGGELKKRSLPEIKETASNVRASNVGSGEGEIKKRSLPETKAPIPQLRSPYEGSGGGEKKKRSLSMSKAAANHKHTSNIASELVEKKRRTLPDENESSIQKVFPTYEDSSTEKKKRRSNQKKEKAQNVKISNKELNTKRELKTQSAIKIPPWDSSDRAKIPPWDANVHSEIPPWDRKRRSLADDKNMASVKDTQFRNRRDLNNNDVSDGALKMAARSDDINDIEASLQKLESIEKKDVVPTEENASESGSGESEGSGTEKRSVIEEETTHSKRSAEKETTEQETKKSKTDGQVDPEAEAKLKSDVEKGVDSLLNLVVELYKQQKTIKNFENSVRSLRHDILKELNIPSKDKHAATAKVRNAIQKAAKDRLHILTSSIEHKITEFAKSHPESVKQARLATSLLPKIPLSDEKLAESKREIQRRSAEFDNIEDGFDEQSQVPTILKEHFKRNAETDVEDIPENVNVEKKSKELHPRKRSAEEDFDFKPKEEVNGERTLSRMHRDVSESEEEGLDDDYEKLFT